VTKSPVRSLVTGDRGAGKTIFCRAVVEAARALPGPPDVAGVLSPRRYEAGVQVGIEAEDLRTGRRRLLARIREPGEVPLSEVTRLWSFDPEALVWGNEVLASAVPCDLLVVDELGPLEFEQGRGWPAGLAAVDSGSFTGALVVVRSGLLAAARRRWPDAAVMEAAGADGAGETARRWAHRLLGASGVR